MACAGTFDGCGALAGSRDNTRERFSLRLLLGHPVNRWRSIALHSDESLAKTDQIGLPLRLKDQASFENFLAGDNQQIVALLQGSDADRDLGVIYLHGAKGAGKSHLLQAFC